VGGDAFGLAAGLAANKPAEAKRIAKKTFGKLKLTVLRNAMHAKTVI
jgi:hypothetical protein